MYSTRKLIDKMRNEENKQISKSHSSQSSSTEGESESNHLTGRSEKKIEKMQGNY